MNRPQNRQPRVDGQQRGRGGRRGGGRGNHAGPDYKPVPSIQQVVPGAAVSIVLKQDQPTGREVQGIVQDLLTRGDHPRGIKVRLTDGRVGRVQRMSTTPSSASRAQAGTPARPTFKHVADVRYEDEYAEGPPPRTFADYFPDEPAPSTMQQSAPDLKTATARCPICEEFEGDEIAVSNHVAKHFGDAPCG
ncbi:hypothetical protein Slin15195_G012730 [Septoria linicola]|uniref:Uncharacterized protein n=1 Tax=Septoria linicola TaxID=215465 RepID=A0A9Q9EFI7_9PEZI|nr:hypothetical protein Slin14017_G012760 [Septoria linicola]USW47954.1 hypothetical protein Slin15195_G012730 [Septoria linicola]